jgi:hypothetical protein
MIPSISSDVKEPSMFNAFIPDTRSVAVTSPGFPELIISNFSVGQNAQTPVKISHSQEEKHTDAAAAG